MRKNSPIDKLRAEVRADYKLDRGGWAENRLREAHALTDRRLESIVNEVMKHGGAGATAKDVLDLVDEVRHLRERCRCQPSTEVTR